MQNRIMRTKIISWVLSLAMIIAISGSTVRVQAAHMISFDENDQSITEEEPAIEEPAIDNPDTNVIGTNDSIEDVPLGELVAHWTFDDNYTESISGLTTNLGAKKITYTNGIHGKAAVFNGKDNYLIVDADAVLNLGNSRSTENAKFSISAWVNLGDPKEGEKYLLDKGTDAGWDNNDDHYWNNPYRISFDGCEPVIRLSNEYRDNSGSQEYVTEGSSSTSGKYIEGEEWFLLTVTYDGKRVKVYRDSELINQNNYTNGITFNNDELYIGVDHSLQSFFKGSVDDLKIYTAALTYDEVDALYQAGLAANKEFVEPTKQLVAYYAFDGDLKDSSSFKNDAEKVAVSGTTKFVTGENGKAITMSKGNYILVPAADQLNFDTEFTVSFWMKLGKEGEYPVLYRQNPSFPGEDDNEYTYQLSIYSWGSAENTELKMDTYAYSPDNWTMVGGQCLYSDFNYSEDKLKGTSWFHFTYTYKDGQMKSYLNGELRDKTEESDLINIANASGDLLIGYDGSTFINGAIDELKIFNSCLSETEAETEAKRIDSISLSAENATKVATIAKGKSVTIDSIQLKDADTGNSSEVKLAGKNFTFKSNNTKIFTVSEDGKITGVKAGKAKLTITYGPHTVTYNIVVN